MRRRFIFIILLLLGSILLFNTFEQVENIADFDPLKIEIGEVFEYLNYEKEMRVLNYEIADVNSDSENDLVIVLGESVDGTDLYKNIDAVVYNKMTESFTSAKLKNYEGKQPKVELKDIDGDSFNEVIIIFIF